ncbi:MAG: TIM barrel protein [Rhodobacterales bacterium]|nr:TIM barrel protein [Rhodobacterales bacterium]MDX5389972.1 TIM barrel protein [Rhodobacterales bacterium]MDX5489663.1 TIM barrel protein [Rhodobacterales bacterium]
MRYSANLGFLFTDLPLPDAIHAAKNAGFDAVECHFPYDVPAAEVAQALRDTGLTMLGLNTWPGDKAAGDFGLAALPGRMDEARAAISQAVDYAVATGTKAVHVMAGRTDGGAAAEDAFRANLAHACDLAAPHGITILIEPINTRDVQGYHLSRTDHAARIIAALNRPNLKLMFDCYHMQIMQGDLATHLRDLMPVIGHIQIAAVPDRGEPDQGEVDYRWLMRHLSGLEYTGFVGAEYRPRAGTDAGLGWLRDFSA